MAALIVSLLGALRSAFRTRADLALENLALRQQLANLQRTCGRPRLRNSGPRVLVGPLPLLVFMPPKPRKPPSQTWRAFLDNHVSSLASIDFFAVPTATFRVLYVFLILAHDRRRVLHFNVTERPSATWTANRSSRPSPRTPRRGS
jgi:hypothetical protein